MACVAACDFELFLDLAERHRLGCWLRHYFGFQSHLQHPFESKSTPRHRRDFPALSQPESLSTLSIARRSLDHQANIAIGNTRRSRWWQFAVTEDSDARDEPAARAIAEGRDNL
jgi:hypothetical protein